MFLTQGQSEMTAIAVPIWLIALCSLVMGLGTSIGGMRIIKEVGMNMVKLEKFQGFAADLAGALCILLSSTTGKPVSTTHTKTTAIMGVGAARNIKKVNWSVVKEMVLTWLLTFPGCGLAGFLMAELFIRLF
jgi:PiT family inorganic phosphate transporter